MDGAQLSGSLQNVRDGLESFRAWATDPRPRIGFGLPFFDDRTRGGIAKAQVCMIQAYSSVGKTTLALNVIANNPSVPTLFLSLEMSWRMVVSRLAAIHTGTPTWELEASLRNGIYPQQMIDTAAAFPLLVGNDQSELAVKDMKALIEKASLSLGQSVRLVVVDYLELVGGAGMMGKSEAVDKAAVKMRSLAKDSDCSVIILHQVSKGDGSGGSEPLAIDSARYGGFQPMDFVVGAYAERLNRKLSKDERDRVKDEVYLQLLKNRSGQAHPDGVRHKLDSATGKLTEWGVAGAARPLRGYQADLNTIPHWSERDEDRYLEEVLR